MFRKNYFTSLLIIALFLAGSFAAFAQSTAPVSGSVVLKKADGTTEPVQGAVVEVFRTDIKGKGPTAKTNKKGEFNFAGLPLGATFVFAVSGEKISPTYMPNVRAGADRLVIDVSDGDGKKLTEEEVRAALATGAATSTPTSQTTAEQKKAMEERAKLEAEYAASKKKVENETSVINNALKEGNAAFNSANYDLAITKYEEGFQANPTFVGSAPVLLNNKGLALTKRAAINYNKGTSTADAAAKADITAKVKEDLQNSIAAFNNSWSILSSANAAEITNQEGYNKAKYDALYGRTDAYYLISRTKSDLTKAAEAKTAYEEYLKVETDNAKKAKAYSNLGEIMINSGDPQAAVAAYKSALELAPDSPDALAGLGLSQTSAGYNADGTINDTMMQEAINNLQKFLDIAPANHALKSSVKETVDYLKTQNFKPQKSTGGKKKN